MKFKWNPFTNNFDYIGSTGGTVPVNVATVTHVANYAALPDPTTVELTDIYICDASQGTSWLPGSVGGTYYPSGVYTSNLTSWIYSATPYQATQGEVNTGTNTDKFVTPSTLTNFSAWSNYVTIGGIQTITGAKTFTGELTVGHNITFTPITNNSLSGANQRIPSHVNANMIFTNAGLTSIASANNGGVVGGHTLCITNSTGAAITIVNNYGSAAAGEAIFTGVNGDFILPNKTTIWLQYNATDSMWACISSGLIPIATGVSGLGAGIATFLATPSSANLMSAITNETGTGLVVFNNTPTFITPILGVATGTSLMLNGATPLTANDFLGVLGNVNTYVQSNIRNSNAGSTASSDLVVSNNLGTDTTYYGDFGMNSSTFTGSGSLFLPNAVYLTATTGDLVLGTTTNNIVRFVINSGATDAMTLSATTATLLLGTLVGTNTTQAVFNTVATTVNAFQAATTLSIGATTGTMTLRNSTIVGGGASLTLFNTTSTTISFAGASTTLTVGGTPTTAVTHNYSTNATATATTKTVNIGTAGASGSTTNLNIGSSVAGSTSVATIQGRNVVQPPVRTSTSAPILQVVTPADTTLTLSTESILTQLGGTTAQATVSRQFATGALTTQRENLIVAPTYTAVGASTITNAATLAITGAPIAGTNATITNSYAMWIQGGGMRYDVGSDATGDIYYRDANGRLQRLAIGTAGQVLTVTAGIPSWTTSSGGSFAPKFYEPFGMIDKFISTWSEADQAYYQLFKCPYDMTITKLFSYTLNVGSDTVRMSICNAAGVELQEGSFTPAAQGYESCTITSTNLTGGSNYWIGIKSEVGSWNGAYITSALSNGLNCVSSFQSGTLPDKTGTATPNRIYVAVGA